VMDRGGYARRHSQGKVSRASKKKKDVEIEQNSLANHPRSARIIDKPCHSEKKSCSVDQGKENAIPLRSVRGGHFPKGGGASSSLSREGETGKVCANAWGNAALQKRFKDGRSFA